MLQVHKQSIGLLIKKYKMRDILKLRAVAKLSTFIHHVYPSIGYQSNAGRGNINFISRETLWYFVTNER